MMESLIHALVEMEEAEALQRAKQLTMIGGAQVTEQVKDHTGGDAYGPRAGATAELE